MIFETVDTTGHEQVVFCHNKASGLKAIIAIHDTTLGPALGGFAYQLLNARGPFALNALLSLLTAWLREKFKIEIEARHRHALHSALETGVNRVLDKLVKLPQVTRADAAVAEAVAYVERSVPDAIKALAPSKDHLRDMALAKAKEALLRAATSDKLTAALQAAGAPAVKP